MKRRVEHGSHPQQKSGLHFDHIDDERLLIDTDGVLSLFDRTNRRLHQSELEDVEYETESSLDSEVYEEEEEDESAK